MQQVDSTKNTIPEWADKTLSLEMPKLRAKGESQDLEYKENFPEQISDLGKEIAAFATSNEGKILLGITDSGELKGLRDIESQEERDELVKRIQGICRGTVKPSITPSIKFAIEDNKIVSVLTVQKGSQPIYYCKNIPYIRHITESRPGEPHEIVELVRNWLEQGEKGTTDFQFLISLGNILTKIIILGGEIDKRVVGPGLRILMTGYEIAANNLRNMASSNLANELGLGDELEKLAQDSEKVAYYQHFLGMESWGKFVSLVRAVKEKAEGIKLKWIDTLLLSQNYINSLKREFQKYNRQLRSLSNRSEQIIESGRFDDAIREASQIGFELMQLSYSGLFREKPDLKKELKEIGFKLHILEADANIHKYFMEKTLQNIASASQRLEHLAKGL